jgi:MFS family permease
LIPKSVLNAAVVVAALGYFVDIYDLILFSVIRLQSLTDLGIPAAELKDSGLLVINVQMGGMLIGGILWGVLGDKRGRLRILFASIILYSLATLANGLVQTLPQYVLVRFVAGVGLAGELGAGVTLVSEILPPKARGWGTMLVASVGLSGAVLANIVHNTFPWRTAYFIGGALGLVLLLLRIRIAESDIFRGIETKDVQRGNFILLFKDAKRFWRYFKTILIGAPTWYLIGILVTFSPEFAKAMGVQGEVDPGWAVMCAYLGLVVGDVCSGLLSQIIGSRRKVVILFHSMSALTVAAFFTVPAGRTPFEVYACCAAIGFAGGYWAIFVTVGAEQFGTNLRATAATTVPNFVRGMLVPISQVFRVLEKPLGLLPAAMVVGGVCIGVALIAAVLLDETFGRDLDFVETP